MNSKQQDTPSVATARAEWATLDPRWLVQYLRTNTTFDADVVGEMIAFAQAAAQQDASAAQAVPDAITNPHPRGSVDYHAHELFISGWNQCRLTMLEARAPAAPVATQTDETPWCPDVCPITGQPFFMWIEHHETGRMVPTYGGPYDSYTIPVKDSHGDYVRERYDHDLGGWRTDEQEDVGVMLVDNQSLVIGPDHPRYDAIERFAEQPASAPADVPKVEPSDEAIIDLAVEPLGMDFDRMPYGVVKFARALLARYVAPLDAAAIRNAALEDAANAVYGPSMTSQHAAAIIRSMKSAFAQPPTSAPDSERDAFEMWLSQEGIASNYQGDGEYLGVVHLAWLAWQARAAIAAKEQK